MPSLLSACRTMEASMAKSTLVAALMLAIAATAAYAEYFTYSEWSQQPADFERRMLPGSMMLSFPLPIAMQR